MENTQVETKVAPYVEVPGEEYMNDNQVEHFRHLLHNWRAQL
ncbi:MAG TPA: RNA polymerase-binding protein DksA, partial [Methylophaga aminisulfidivorans]|nr:RNA polymerase-binding protein DksA [Methylophaga aminisulfidivorans]